MKAFTDLEQGRKLTEILPIESADMYWWCASSNFGKRYYIEAMDDADFSEEEGHIRAWSLAALLNALPRIEHLRPSIDLNPKLDSNEVAIYYHSEDSPYIVRDNLIDAAFEMVMWLKENKKI